MMADGVPAPVTPPKSMPASGKGGGGGNMDSSSQTREQRDLLRFMYQTSCKGCGKSYQDWIQAWKQCRLLSVNVTANSLEGAKQLQPSIFSRCFKPLLALICSLHHFFCKPF